jgi:hypothetical protein
VIGGRVLDTSAVVQFASNTSIYMQSAVWVALEESLVLAIPATSLAEAWARAAPTGHDALEVLLGLPITMIDPLDAAQTEPVGKLLAAASAAAHLRAGHVVHVARRRGWQVITAAAAPLRQIDPELDVEELP